MSRKPVSHRLLIALSLVACAAALFACGKSDTCAQVGPPVGYPIQQRDLFLAVGQQQGQLVDAFFVIPGADVIGLPPEHWDKFCYARPEDQPNYTWVGWIDSSYSDADGGADPRLVDPRYTYCADFQAAGCGPQPGQPHGKLVVTMREGQNNIVIIPLSP